MKTLRWYLINIWRIIATINIRQNSALSTLECDEVRSLIYAIPTRYEKVTKFNKQNRTATASLVALSGAGELLSPPYLMSAFFDDLHKSRGLGVTRALPLLRLSGCRNALVVVSAVDEAVGF